MTKTLALYLTFSFKINDINSKQLEEKFSKGESIK